MNRSTQLRVLALVSVWTAFGACAPAVSPPRPTVSLRLRGGPPEATVVVDEETLGTFEYVAAHGVALPPGIHRVTVQAPGYFPWDREVEAKSGTPPILLEVAMSPVPD
ncbi:MAG TPA: PEGA domain-containing protein [Polyangiaceae bacterium]|nr:PEGA domain-containing protein [Polyangiaceae bacterium]